MTDFTLRTNTNYSFISVLYILRNSLLMFLYVLKKDQMSLDQHEPGSMLGRKEFQALQPVTWALMVNIITQYMMLKKSNRLY